MRGIVFAKQFPNPAEPLRGSFVADQVLATRDSVDWRVIAPVPWVPKLLAGMAGKPYVRGAGHLDGIPVARPRYPVLPRRRLYRTVAPSMAIASRRAFAAAILESAPDFVHVHDLYPSGAALMRLAISAGVPYVVTIHGSDLYSNLVRDSWAGELRKVVDGAAAIVCVSSSLRRDAVGRIGADPTRALVIPDAYDDATFPYVTRAGHGGRVRFMTVGRLVPEKGHEVLVRAFADAVLAGMDAQLDIVGAGPERERLEALAEARGIGERVTFLGAISRQGLAAALAEADAFVLPSLREGFGVALVEALATGLPAAATRSGGPEDILAGEDGLLVEPGDVPSLAEALVALSDSLASYPGEAIARRARLRFGRDAVAARLVDLYRAVAEDRVVEHVAEETRRGGPDG